jgi:uncharacterized protein YjbJ (UPF0337 family)
MDQNEIEGKAQKLGGKVQSAVGDLTGDTKTQAEGMGRQVYGKVQDAYGQVRDNAGEMGGQILDKLDELGGTLAQTIEERPFASVLVAGAIGYVLALLTTSRR